MDVRSGLGVAIWEPPSGTTIIRQVLGLDHSFISERFHFLVREAKILGEYLFVVHS